MNFAITSGRILVWLIASCHVVKAFAYLGGDVASIEADRVHMSAHRAATHSASPMGSITVQEMSLPTGTIVRQYVSAPGLVFAVTWSGPFKPDLHQLLGPHFDTMVARQAHHVHAGHHFVDQHEPDLVIESGGHARSFVGRAYLPNAIPAGLAVEEIQ